jgi:hypothetical protein
MAESAPSTLIAAQGTSLARPPLQRPRSAPTALPAPSIQPAPGSGPQPVAPAATAGSDVGPHPMTLPTGPATHESCSDDAVLDDPTAAPAPAAQDEAPRKRFQHKGLVADLRVGTLGCIGALCRGGHDVRPGVRLGGFLGGNIRGWFELGVGGGWGTLTSKITPGTNALLLYGLDAGTLQQALLAQAAGLINVDFAGLAVQDGQLRAAQVGPSMRIHLVPRGRIGAFVGSGVGYNGLRANYQTAAGDVGLAFHGVHVPVEANLSVYVLEHLAVGLQFDYMWTWYGVAVLDHPQQRIAVPMGVLQTAARQQGVDLRGQLPQFWTLGLALRGRL